MSRRLAREETGAALALAVIMVVLVGVMGAGLLVFVRNDLTSVVEVNRGQSAMEAADAGVKLAKNQLSAVASPSRYNGAGDGVADSAWSSYSGGRNLAYDGETIRISVRYLPAVAAPATPGNDEAPETIPGGATQLPGGREYFRVISTGEAGSARRTVEAVLNTYDLDVPKGYFTPGNITVNGSSACISGVSLFAIGNINIPANGRCPDGKAITGRDEAYRYWQNDVNPTPRLSDAAGVGATGTVSTKIAGRDYDSSTCPKFVRDYVNDPSSCTPPTKMTFPFNPDPQNIELRELERIAREQDAETVGTTNYYEVSASSESAVTWPANSTKETVVYYKFTDGTPANNSLKWFVSGSCSDNPPKQGTLVVEGAAFTTQPNKARFRGVVIVREGEYVPGTADDGTSSDSGNTCLEGFVNASGNITISGSVSPFTLGEDLADRPGFVGVRQWSWRECYSINCS